MSSFKYTTPCTSNKHLAHFGRRFREPKPVAKSCRNNVIFILQGYKLDADLTKVELAEITAYANLLKHKLEPAIEYLW